MQTKPQTPLAALIKNQTFEGPLLVRAAEQRASQNGNKYLDMTLSDLSGETNAKMWDGTVAAPKVGDVVLVRGVMLEYNNRPQFRADKLRVVEDISQIDMAALLPCAPEPPEAMYEELARRAGAIAAEDIQKLTLHRLENCRERLLYYPAAQRLHHAERAGLLHHTVTMLRVAEAILPFYPFLDGDLLCAGVILHDLCKISELNSDEFGLVSEYTSEGQLLGHLVQGVSVLAQDARELGVEGENLLLLEHMILSHHDLPEYGSPKPPMFPEAEMLHALDLMDARMFEMDRALKNLAPGAFTEKIWSLERKLYRRKD
jgi:3'-5' exoribonuclease